MRSALALGFGLGLATLIFACTTKTTEVTNPPAAADSGTSGSESSGGESSGTSGTSGTSGNTPGPLTFASTAFEDGAKLPVEHTCSDTSNPKDTSPPLAWTGGPEGTKSFGIALYDETFDGFEHSVILDIPATVLELPANVEKAYQPKNVEGAKQTKDYGGSGNGYRGPCPPSGEHTYVFEIYALDVDTMPGVTDKTTAAAGKALLEKHKLESKKLKAKFQKP